MKISYKQILASFRRKGGEFPMLYAGFLAIAMIFSARFMLGFVWKNALSYELTFLVSLIYMESMFVFTGRWWDKKAREGPLNIIPTLVIVFMGTIITLGALPFLVVGGLISWPVRSVRFKMANVEAFLFSFVLGNPVDYYGKVKRDKPVIYYSKHRSFRDVIDAMAVLDAIEIKAVSKQFMFFVPHLAPFLILQGIMIKRGKDGKAVARSAVAVKQKVIKTLVEDKESVLLYPEGTRSEKFLPFKHMMSQSSFENGIDLVPLAITADKPYAGRFWLQPHPRRRAYFGASIDPKEFKSWKELNEYAERRLEVMLTW